MVWLPSILFSQKYWEFLIIPIDELIFFRGVGQPPTFHFFCGWLPPDYYCGFASSTSSHLRISSCFSSAGGKKKREDVLAIHQQTAYAHVCVSIYLSIHPSIHPSIYPSIYLSIYLYTYMCVYRYIQMYDIPKTVLAIRISISFDLYRLSLEEHCRQIRLSMFNHGV